MCEENARLRHEVHRINNMFVKIKAQNKQNKVEQAHLSEVRKQLKSRSKKLQSQQDELDYKRQQIEKEY